MEESFITGAALMKRWKIERHELMRRITLNNERHDFHFTDFRVELWPYSPAYHTPYRLDIHKCFQKSGWHGCGFFSPPLPLANNHNWECCQIIDWPGDIYESLGDALFRRTDVEAFEKGNPLTIKTGKASKRHHELARQVAAELWLVDKERTIEDVISTDRFIAAFNRKSYSKKTLRNWIKDLCPNRQPGRRKTKI